MAFGHLLRDAVYATYLVSEGGRDDDGNPIPPEWKEPFKVRCRLEDRQQLVRAESGDEVVSKTHLVTDIPVQSRWLFWFDDPGNDPDRGDAIEPLAVGSAGTLDGRARLYEVHFG